MVYANALFFKNALSWVVYCPSEKMNSKSPMHGARVNEVIESSLQPGGSMGKITEFDRQVLKKAIADKALDTVDQEKIVKDVNGEGQVVACSDGDIRADTEHHLDRKGLHRRHEILAAGGPLPLGPGSPAASLNSLLPGFLKHVLQRKKRISWLVRLLTPVLTLLGHLIRIDMIMFVQLWLGIEIKKMKVIVLMPHVPCGIAGYYHLDVVQQFLLMIGAKTRLKSMFPDNTVMLLIHVDWGDGNKNTYRFSKERIGQWLIDNRDFILALKARLAAEEAAQLPHN